MVFGTRFASFTLNQTFTSLFVLYEALEQKASYFPQHKSRRRSMKKPVLADLTLFLQTHRIEFWDSYLFVAVFEGKIDKKWWLSQIKIIPFGGSA